MFVATTLLTLLLSASLDVPAVAHRDGPHPRVSQASQGPKVIEIDGKKNPEMIPEHAAWKAGFHFIARPMSPGIADSIRIREMKLSEADFATFQSYGDKLRQFEKRQGDLYKDAFAELTAQKADQAAIRKLSDDTEMAIRVETLRLADELLGKLSDEARYNAAAWISVTKAKISITILESELANYRRPR